MMIYHITTLKNWNHAQQVSQYSLDSLASDGFIHASTWDQVVGTGNYLFRGQTGLVVLAIDTDQLAAEVKFEAAPGTDQQFPHIYGPINLDAVVQVIDFSPEPDGSFRLPSR